MKKDLSAQSPIFLTDLKADSLILSKGYNTAIRTVGGIMESSDLPWGHHRSFWRRTPGWLNENLRGALQDRNSTISNSSKYCSCRAPFIRHFDGGGTPITSFKCRWETLCKDRKAQMDLLKGKLPNLLTFSPCLGPSTWR